MNSFEELGVAPELVESLSREGIERPTPVQEAAIPMLRRGNNLLLAAGPGSGLLVGWAVGLVERVAPDGDPSPAILVLTAEREGAEELAESLARITLVSGHSVAALGSAWALPGHARILLGTPEDVLAAVATGSLNLGGIEALVVDQAQRIAALNGLEAVERIIDFIPPEAQRVASALPVTPAVTRWVERHFRRAMTVPHPHPEAPSDAPVRGSIRMRVTSEPREDEALQVVDQLLQDGARHVLVFSRSEDRAADLGDHLTLRGYVAGEPGNPAVPVWLGVDPLEARRAAQGAEGVVVVSCDAPEDADTLDRRHSITPDGVVLVLPREVPHLRAAAHDARYEVSAFSPRVSEGERAVEQLRRTLREALVQEDLGPYLYALEPIFEVHDPAEVAAAAVALLRKRSSAPGATVAPPAATRGGAAPAWAKLFLGVGSRDGLVAGDVLGAITGEANVPGSSVGKIEIRESHTVVEVHDDVARQVIDAINGTTLRGRAVRVDFDRPRRAEGRDSDRGSDRGRPKGGPKDGPRGRGPSGSTGRTPGGKGPTRGGPSRGGGPSKRGPTKRGPSKG